MKNKFKILFLSFFLLTSCSNGRTKSYENNFRKNQYGNHIFIEAKLDAYRNLNDVEKETEVIVLGKKIKQNPSTIQKNNGYVNGVYTISNFKIEKVFKGNFKAGDIIVVFESAGIDEKTGKIYHIEGYELMEKDEKYLLFLRHSETDPWYMISGLKFGKISLSGKKGDLRLEMEKANEYLEEFENEDRIREEAIKKYIEK
ncbi:hypothetical protein NM219_00975 [Parvimonas micra]|uniref:Lipoprotein n=1 Tax=Parvimonas micra TaxID=33033 RepID=A0A930H4R0_9FIRM|nr:hypothetical protein [Parvimonas micra]MBF1306504.1 hypothetical protein [Parvimonas micra]WBB32610.1 hypothetical protein NM221_00960 [Parvimonas micra]WBB34115.1 hypothetical protein NM220_00975 [Parvimonas micra]WBB35636.1 hypothetical protein NM219_00975 [Parvimonas micra]